MAFIVPYINSIAYFNKFFYCYRLSRVGQSITPQSNIAHLENCYCVALTLLNFLYDKARYLLNGISRRCK